ncbi:hypothetical protein GCM10009740_23460 [Terrabacter terrae]|uniref:Secreted protein n=1 Tax=Terrabacter terrae TaxID=318434 RepID=A0ABN2U990_9MICO
MSRPRPTVRPSTTLAVSVLALAGGLTVAAPPTVSALTLPSPISTSTSSVPTVPALPGTDGSNGLLGQVTAPLTAGRTGTGAASTPSGSATALPGLPSAPAPSLGSVGTGVKSALSTTQSTARAQAAGSPLAPVVPGPRPGGVLDLAVNASPLATACLRATGSGTAVADTTVTVAGRNVSAPLVQALPGLLAACPGGSVPSTNGVDASVPGLVGACVRVTTTAPLHASLLVLDKELVATLTRSGVPLGQAVVPCPAGAAHVVKPGQSGQSGQSGQHGATGTAGRTTGAHASAVGDANGRASGKAGACAPGTSDGTSLDARATAAGLVPHDAPQALPWVLLGLALVGRRRLGRMVAALRSARG